MSLYSIRNLIACLCIFLLSATSVASTQDKFHFIVGGTSKGLRNYNKMDAEITFHNAMSKLVSDKKYKVDLKIYESTPELKTAVENKDVTGIFSSSLEYLDFEASQTPLLGVQFNGAQLKQALLVIVRKDDGAKNLSDYKGKKLVLSDEQDIEKMYLNTLLLKNGQSEIDDYFGEKIKPKNSNVAMMNVYFKQADITVVRESEFATAVELNPQLGKKLVVLNKSPGFISLVVSFNKESAYRATELIDILTQLSSSVTGRSFLRLANAQTMVAISDEDLKEVKALSEDYKSLRKQKK